MPLPSFIVVGAVKAGTTSLYNYLGQHPEIQMSSSNWPRYFHVADGAPDFDAMAEQFGDELREESEGRYNMMCPPSVPRDISGYDSMWPQGNQVNGEVSPTYLHDANVCKLIAERIPHAKLIAVLRNPVDRAYSHFVMDRRRNWESIPDFDDALAAEPADVDEFWWGRRQYVRHGLYANTVRQYQESFAPGQLKVMFYDDLIADSDAYMREMLTFIGVDPEFRIDTTTRHHKGLVKSQSLKSRLLYAQFPGKQFLKRHLPSVAREKIQGRIEDATHAEPEPMSSATKSRLVDMFRDDVNALQSLVDRDLSHWLQGARQQGCVIS